MHGQREADVSTEQPSPSENARLPGTDGHQGWTARVEAATRQRAQAVDRFRRAVSRFRPAEHIRRRADFERAYAAGSRVTGRFMTVFARPTDLAIPRIGIAATKKIGTAIVRNRAKRLVRELFRHQKPNIALDIVVIPRREFLDAPYASLEREFSNLLERARTGGGSEVARSRSRHTRRAGSPSRL